MKANGESIYATKASPFAKTPGDAARRNPSTERPGSTCTCSIAGRRQTDRPGCRANRPAGLLAGGARLDAAAEDGAVTITLPQKAPSKIATVVVLDVE